MRHHQRGFTLIEIAIVLVIIGLLLGGVLKGQELIQSAKVKNMVNDFRTVSTFVYAYQDRFRRIPGDDANVVANVAGTLATTPAGTIGNGRINGNWNSVTPTDESYLFWEHVRRANLATGDTTIGAPGYIYRNADSGQVGITGDQVVTDGSWPGNFFVCSDNIQGRVARQIDVTMDDGNTALGSVRVLGGNGTASVLNAAALPANLTTANDAALYTVCVQY